MSASLLPRRDRRVPYAAARDLHVVVLHDGAGTMLVPVRAILPERGTPRRWRRDEEAHEARNYDAARHINLHRAIGGEGGVPAGSRGWAAGVFRSVKGSST